ncbi:ficolin-1-like [Anopheles ziemanni]|uniref:ficolin-1-like n=1 Tax=Anopheles coustani TaxID=139045 RepID=UPI0026594728|nr:ficolin-1-like [Anopheles coustani]XP_058166905.1 ficolin-1-like [Anopheles ziemanni]
MEHRLQERLTKHENNINEKIETIEARMHAMEESFIKSVKSMEASNENTRTKLEALKNHVIPKMEHIQETSDSELKKIGEYKNTLDMLIDTVQNISMQAKFNTRLFKFLYPVSSCRQALSVSDTYMIKIEVNTEPFEVFCEQNKFDGGWIVIQHRYDGSVDFYTNWTEYRNGFGSLDGEFWLGLEYVHQITKNRAHELLVEMKDFHGNYGYAKYGEFEIGNESELYVLKKLGTYSGTAGDSMKNHKDQKFTTFDRDNDEADKGNCAKAYHGAWWYYNCYRSNLNARYMNATNDLTTMSWKYFKNDRRGLSYTRMMIRDIVD